MKYIEKNELPEEIKNSEVDLEAVCVYMQAAFLLFVYIKWFAEQVLYKQ